MKKKTFIFLILIFICLLTIKYFSKENKCFSSSITITCVGQEYEKVTAESYLTFELSDKKISKRILINEKMTSELSQDNVDEVIGVQIIMNIPRKELTKRHFNTEDLNIAWLLFETDIFDNYCQIVDVSFR